MNQEKKDKTLKKIAIILFSILALLIVFTVVLVRNLPSAPRAPKESSADIWAKMTYEQRHAFLQKMIDDRDFAGNSQLTIMLKEKIAYSFINPSTIKYTMQPSLYNEFVNIVEADSGWIYVPIRGTCKNDFGVDKEFAGAVMYIYNPINNTIGVKHWDVAPNE